VDLFLQSPICHYGVQGDYFNFSAHITNSAPFRQIFDQNFFPPERHNSIEEKQTCVQCDTYGGIRCANTGLLREPGGIGDFGVGVEEDIQLGLKINRF
jgi:hypothetical protein